MSVGIPQNSSANTSTNTSTNTLRVAIIGSGPSGFYAAEHLLKQTNRAIQVDMYDRLPTPYGLVRGGVAPDHAKIKSVTKVYEKTAANPNFRFYGNVEFGADITRDELRTYYHAVIYAVGAQTDRRMGVPGEDLAGSHAATEFVGWYNAHPDYRDHAFDLSQTAAAVIGNGNVAMDVARILAAPVDELAKTDMGDHAIEALRNSSVRDIYVLARRGPAQAAFTNPEIKELGELEGVDVIVRPEEIDLDPITREMLTKEPNSLVEKNLKVLQQYAQRGDTGAPRKIHMRFLVSPVELIGDGQVQQIKLVHNVLQQAPDGSLKAVATDKFETLNVGLVFRSIGYMGVALPGVPFDKRGGVIPNKLGRVLNPETGEPLTGDYVVGWIKRGPSGVIGTNKPDSVETVNMLLEDADKLPAPEQADPEAIEALIRARKPECVSFHDWLTLDQIEQANGAPASRPRVKFSRVQEMLEAIKAAKATAK